MNIFIRRLLSNDRAESVPCSMEILSARDIPEAVRMYESVVHGLGPDIFARITPEELAAGKRYEQLDLFGDDEAQSYGSEPADDRDGEHDIQRALLDVKRKFGRNAVIKAMDMEDGATGQDRNRQIGGHRA